MRTIKTVIKKNNTIELPEEVMKQMLLQEGDSISIAFDLESIADKCFFIEDDIENKVQREGYYCIPMQLFEQTKLNDEDIQVLIGEQEITVTSTSKILTTLPNEILGALIDQQVDLTEFVDDMVERINHYVFESEEESI